MYYPLFQLFTFSTSSTSRLLRNGFILLVFAIAFLMLTPRVQAVTPAPDGDYPNENTVTVASGLGVIVGSTGQLGTVTSSARFKEAIKPMDKASEAILALQPVTFRYKHELDPDGIPQFGLVAEQVEQVNPDLVVRDQDGKVNTVRYEAVNAMLLNEFLKEHRRVEEQGATIAQQKKGFASELARQQKAFEAKFAGQQKQIEALTATVQKVSDQVALGKPVPHLVANP